MRYWLKISMLTMSIAGLLQLAASCSYFTRGARVVNQNSSESRPNNIGSEGPKPCEASRVQEENSREVRTQELLKTEFEGLFEPDGQRISPNCLVADFNGDGVDDIAISVKLASSFATTEKKESPFRFSKPLGPGMPPDEGRYSFKVSDLVRYRNESILIVLHGVAGRGWNDSEPKQRFVIVDGWDAGRINMASYRGKLEPVAAGDSAIVPPPLLLGDAILMLGHENKGTALYWDGNQYRWYPVGHAP